MRITKILATSALVAAGLSLGACSSIRETRGYVTDAVLLNAVQPGIDNQRSVEATLGRPTFTSQFGDPTWYYVTSTTGRKPFVRTRIQQQHVLAVKFGPDGNVTAADRTGLDQVVYLTPDGNETPTLGRERSFLEDLFGNIGTVGQAGLPGSGQPGS